MRTQLIVTAAVAAASLATGTSALARAGDRTVSETYPAATALCASAHAGMLRPKLQLRASAVIAACDTLANAFPPLAAAVGAAESQFMDVVSAQKALVSAACTRPVSDHAACVSARLAARAAITTARDTERTAILAFHTAVKTNRNTFWTTIQTLRSSSSTSG